MSKSDLAGTSDVYPIRADSTEHIAPLVSILVPSRRPHQFAGLIESLQTSLADHRSVEVLAKIDNDDPRLLEAYREIARNSPVTCKLVIGPRLGGVFTLWIGMEEALVQADKNAYFVIALTDEGRFLTPGWDSFLRKYVGFFSDDVFRLRLSHVTKLVQYANYLTCSTMPESFPIFTRRWLELTEGFTRLSYGFDAYQQAVATRLAIDDTLNRNIWNSRGMYRDVPISGIELGGIDFGKDISEIETITRMVVGTREWLRLVSYREQDHISYLATKLRLYIVSKARFKSDFRLQQNPRLKMVSVVDKAGEVLVVESYRISRFRSYCFYARALIGLLPARMNYFRHELRISMRLYRLSNPARARRYRFKIPSLPKFDFPSLRLPVFLRPKIRPPTIPVPRVANRSRMLHLATTPALWVIVLATMTPWRKIGASNLFYFRRALRLPAYLQLPYMFVFAMRRITRWLKKRRYPGVLIDFLFYPIDRLLWAAPALCGSHLPRNPFSIFARLKRLGYPVPHKDEIDAEMRKIEDIKRVHYREIRY